MKRIVLAILLLALAQCTSKKTELPSTPLPPPTDSGKGQPSEPNEPVDPVMTGAALPTELSAADFQRRQLVSVQVGDLVPQAQQLVAATLPHLMWIPEAAQMAAALPGMVPQAFGRVSRGFVEELVPRHWRAVLDAADFSAGVTVSLVSRESGGHTVVVRFATDASELEARLSRGDLGQFRKTSWGGRLSFSGHLNHKGARDLFIAFDQDHALLAGELRLLGPAIEVLRTQAGQVPAGFPVFVTVHNVHENVDLYMKKMAGEFNSSERRKLEPVAQVLRPELESLRQLTFGLGLDGNLAFIVDLQARAVDNPTGPMVKAAMVPVDVGDLAVHLPGKPFLVGLDKSSLDFLRPLYKKIQGELAKAQAEVKGTDEALLMGQFGSVIELVDKFFEWSADSQVGAWTLRKGRLHMGGMLQLKQATSGKEMMDAVEKLAKSWNPKTMLPLMSPEARKELAWVPKVFEIRTRTAQVEKRPALIVTFKFNWKAMPKSEVTEELTIFSQFIGNELEFALVNDAGRMWMVAGALWKDELKDMLSGKGRLPEPRLKQASESTMSLSAFDLNAFSAWLAGEVLRIKFPVAMSTDARALLQAAVAQLGKMTGYAWMTYSAGLQPDRSFRMRFTMEKECWPIWVAWGFMTMQAR